jgi:TorA-specific chaperone
MAEDGMRPGPAAADAAERAAVYRWLSGLFAAPPDAEALAVYASAEGADLLDALAADPALAPAVENLRARSGAGDRRAAALALAAGYEWLFSGQAGPRTASPYASVHTSARGLTHQAATAAAARDLDALGLHVAGLAEPPDHIAVLLAAMAELAGRGAAPADQVAFLDRHLMTWIGAFRDACRASDRDGFYSVAAAALADFIHADRQALAEALA